MNAMPKFLPADFASDQEVRWCPGCGDYSILKAVQRTLSQIGAKPENTVCISGIGCSSRFPYYLETYGFHTIHGRAPAIATGVKLANPALDVWIVTGDGDGLSIGGNHMLHLLRRNLDCQVLLFNNEVYGLTKGQCSPTSRTGTRSPSTPFGSVERPINPCGFALGAGARFIARSYDVAQSKMPDVLKRAHSHRGASFVEIYQNCIVYNDGAFERFAGKKAAPDALLWLEAGKPMLFANGKKGLRLNRERLKLEVVPVADQNSVAADVLVHDETNRSIAQLLIDMPFGSFPTALGVIYCDPTPAFDSAVIEQNNKASAGKKRDLNALLRRGDTWSVDGDPRIGIG
ncbi:MAG: 2-oxoacid:ferredoxin oxidoreductase subunit beta [Xanthobacteraceae bacterium]|jgi:2-oxoglutarate ferredoxin oxidoreductase subunit beta